MGTTMNLQVWFLLDHLKESLKSNSGTFYFLDDRLYSFFFPPSDFYFSYLVDDLYGLAYEFSLCLCVASCCVCLLFITSPFYEC